jgi:hypothetical protein
VCHPNPFPHTPIFSCGQCVCAPSLCGCCRFVVASCGARQLGSNAMEGHMHTHKHTHTHTRAHTRAHTHVHRHPTTIGWPVGASRARASPTAFALDVITVCPPVLCIDQAARRDEWVASRKHIEDQMAEKEKRRFLEGEVREYMRPAM